jgi:hypothetical protein
MHHLSSALFDGCHFDHTVIIFCVHEPDQGRATLIGARRFLLLAERGQAVETDDSFCERAFAATMPENVQVVDDSPK